MILESYLKSMVVDIFINIIRIKSVESLGEWKVSGDGIVSINRHKVCSAKDSIEMNDWGGMGSILSKLGSNYPHSS